MSGQVSSTNPKKPVKPGNKKRTPPRNPQRNKPRTPPPERTAPRQPAPERKPQKRPAPQRPAPANPDAVSKARKAKPVRKPKPPKRKASPAKKQQVAAVLILLLTLYLLINLAVFGILLLDFNRQPGETQSYSLVLRKNKTKVAAVDAAQANNDYGLYVPYSKLSLLVDLSIMGDKDNVIMIVRPGNDRIEINNNSSLIYINDNAIRLPKPVIFQINDYLLPIELISNYMDGITITYDNKKSTCTLSRSTENDAVVSTKIIVPDGLGKCSIPPEPPPSQTSSDTSSGSLPSEDSSSTTSHTDSTGSTTSSTSSAANTSSQANSTASNTSSTSSTGSNSSSAESNSSSAGGNSSGATSNATSAPSGANSSPSSDTVSDTSH